MTNPTKKFLCLLFLFGLTVTGCSGKSAFSILQTLPGDNSIPGWSLPEKTLTYDKDTIFQLMDGEAEFFFRYGFELVAVGDYQNSGGVSLEAEVWQLATPADAYGLFSVNDAGDPVSVGKANEGNLQTGNKLVFWQDRYFVLLRPSDTVPDADLQKFADAISAGLPTGGEPPAIMDRLPAEGRAARSEIFFHEELAIQNKVYLGGENILGLSQSTDGALAEYQLNGVKANLIIIQYPDAAAAAAGLAALNNYGLDNLIAAQASGNLLGAVFGKADKTSAGALLAEALAAK
jgi:hypothetical protein